MSEQIDDLVRSVLASRKYRNVCEEIVRHIGARELAVRRNVRDAVKATKSKLHQVGGAYMETNIDYARALDELRRAAESGNREEFRPVCRRLMNLHASTKERVGILEEFYSTTLAGIGPIQVVLDLACGLNPLAVPWMPVRDNVVYYAYDIYVDMVSFIGEFMTIAGIAGRAEARDVTQSPPTQKADLALVLKTLPCLEQLDSAAGARLLETVNAQHLLVSFPVHSLGGRNKGMTQNYETRFRELVRGKPWPVQRFEFATELAFLVTKR
jgi:16S rRNA (guanine(1405)-N(7))-methyltransferase